MLGRRKTLRRGEPTPEEKRLARIICRNRANGQCEMRESLDCTGDRVLPLEGELLVRGHLAHYKSKRRFGWHESATTGQRHIWACAFCHSYEHGGGKPCPPKH